mmetsp:Transcript_47577/g.146832  ORF Transcript_47577/g.146832 Transcript_47577/m.146832 type:complete len:254 (-) Transcript_47577:441-1202(-)
MLPPERRKIRCQLSELKSTFFKMPTPKKTTMGISATTPVSPRMSSSGTHHRTTVMSSTPMMMAISRRSSFVRSRASPGDSPTNMGTTACGSSVCSWLSDRLGKVACPEQARLMCCCSVSGAVRRVIVLRLWSSTDPYAAAVGFVGGEPVGLAVVGECATGFASGIGMKSTDSKGRQKRMTMAHAATVPTTTMGPAAAIHFRNEMLPSPSADCATAFCGDAMGVSMPPKLHANATPRRIACGAPVSASSSHKDG